MATAKRPQSDAPTSTTRDYKYTQEISQMVRKFPYQLSWFNLFLQMFVFGEVQDPYPETVNLVEDIVRGQLIELVRILFLPLDYD